MLGNQVKHNLYAKECCPPTEHSPYFNACFLDDIIEGYEKLYKYGVRKFTTPLARLDELAVPTRRRKPHVFQCACMFPNATILEQVNPRVRLNLRSEHLALPPARRLSLRRKDFLQLFDEKRMQSVNRLLRKSYYSLYTRLMNSPVPPCPPAKKEKTDEEKKKRAKIQRYLKAKIAKLAQPKEVPEPPPLEKTHGEISMSRLKRLATPKSYPSLESKEWVFTKAMNKHKSSDREKKMAEPKTTEHQEPYELPRKVSPGALKYKPTDRIKEIAEPKAIRVGEKDEKENPYAVQESALKYRITKRMKEMAEPKEYPENIHLREHPSLISPTALTYKATPRIIKLAEPKGH